jgi:hypothetical protein
MAITDRAASMQRSPRPLSRTMRGFTPNVEGIVPYEE